MYNRVSPNRGELIRQFVEDIHVFIENAIRQPQFSSNGGTNR
jgi:hypothetical protein